MKKSTSIIITLIISAIITIIGGALLSVATFFGFLKPLAITLLCMGGSATLISFVTFISPI